MSSFQQRLLVGGLIGALMFICLSFIASPVYLGLEKPILASRNFLNISSFFKQNKGALVLNLDQKTMRLMNQDLSNPAAYDAAFLKDFLENIILNLDSENVSSINIAINNISGNLLSSLNLGSGLPSLGAPLDIITEDFEVSEFKQENSKTYLLNQNASNYRSASLADFLNGKISPSDLQGRAIIIKSEFDKKSFTGNKINSVVNYSSANWLHYMRFHPILGFLLASCAGVLFVSTVVRIRWIILGFLGLSILTIGQLMFFFDKYLESSVILLSLILSCALSFALDAWEARQQHKVSGATTREYDDKSKTPTNNGYKAVLERLGALLSQLSSFSFQAGQNLREQLQKHKPSSLRIPDLAPMPRIPLPEINRQLNSPAILDSQELRNKIYKELEYSLDLLSKDIQVRTVAPLSRIQMELDDLCDRLDLDITSQTKFELIRYDFEKIITELDTLLFTMVPFQFESGRGLIDPLEIYARKITEIYRGKPRIYLSPNAAHVELDSIEKANLFRIIQRLVECIIEENTSKLLSHINIDVLHMTDNLNIKLTYDGLPIKEDSSKHKLREIVRRADLIGASLDLGFNWGEDHNAHLVNRIQLSMKVTEHEPLTSIYPN